jgi:hypothetical protein
LLDKSDPLSLTASLLAAREARGAFHPSVRDVVRTPRLDPRRIIGSTRLTISARVLEIPACRMALATANASGDNGEHACKWNV